MSTPEVPFDARDQSLPHKARGPWGSRRKGIQVDGDGVRNTRIGRAWVAVCIAAILGVALIDFIVQNTRSVRIEFFSADGQIPVAVALLGSALAGSFLVLAVGIARTTQLRIANRRGRKREEHAAAVLADPPESVSPR